MSAPHHNPFGTRRVRAAALAAALVALTATYSGTADAATLPSTPHVSGGAATATPSAAEEVRSWTLTPAAVEGAGNRADFSYFADQGTDIDDAVTLFNLGTSQLTFRVYAADAFTRDDGAFDVQSRDATPTGAGSWVTLEQDLVTVPAGQQVTIPLTIAVPADAEPGDHAAGILASVFDDTPTDPNQPVQVEFRTGTRLYVRVNGDAYPSLAINDLAVAYNAEGSPTEGSVDVTFRVSNRGNVRFGGQATVIVAGPFGLREQRLTLEPITDLLPGSDVVITATIDEVPALGLVFATIELAPDVSATEGTADTVVATARAFAPPWALLAVFVAVLLAVVARRARKRRSDVELLGTASRRLPDPELTLS